MKGSTTSSGKHRNTDTNRQGLFRDSTFSQQSADVDKWGHDLYEQRMREDKEIDKSFGSKKSIGGGAGDHQSSSHQSQHSQSRAQQNAHGQQNSGGNTNAGQREGLSRNEIQATVQNSNSSASNQDSQSQTYHHPHSNQPNHQFGNSRDDQSQFTNQQHYNQNSQQNYGGGNYNNNKNFNKKNTGNNNNYYDNSDQQYSGHYSNNNAVNDFGFGGGKGKGKGRGNNGYNQGGNSNNYYSNMNDGGYKQQRGGGNWGNKMGNQGYDGYRGGGNNYHTSRNNNYSNSNYNKTQNDINPNNSNNQSNTGGGVKNMKQNYNNNNNNNNSGLGNTGPNQVLNQAFENPRKKSHHAQSQQQFNNQSNQNQPNRTNTQNEQQNTSGNNQFGNNTQNQGYKKEQQEIELSSAIIEEQMKQQMASLVIRPNVNSGGFGSSTNIIGTDELTGGESIQTSQILQPSTNQDNPQKFEEQANKPHRQIQIKPQASLNPQNQSQLPSQLHQQSNTKTIYVLDLKIQGQDAQIKIEENDNIEEIVESLTDIYKINKDLQEAIEVYIRQKLEAENMDTLVLPNKNEESSTLKNYQKGLPNRLAENPPLIDESNRTISTTNFNLPPLFSQFTGKGFPDSQIVNQFTAQNMNFIHNPSMPQTQYLFPQFTQALMPPSTGAPNLNVTSASVLDFAQEALLFNNQKLSGSSLLQPPFQQTFSQYHPQQNPNPSFNQPLINLNSLSVQNLPGFLNQSQTNVPKIEEQHNTGRYKNQNSSITNTNNSNTGNYGGKNNYHGGGHHYQHGPHTHQNSNSQLTPGISHHHHQSHSQQQSHNNNNNNPSLSQQQL